MIINWIDGTVTKVFEKHMNLCETYNNYFFIATTIDNRKILCRIDSIKFMELPD